MGGMGDGGSGERHWRAVKATESWQMAWRHNQPLLSRHLLAASASAGRRTQTGRPAPRSCLACRHRSPRLQPPPPAHRLTLSRHEPRACLPPESGASPEQCRLRPKPAGSHAVQHSAGGCWAAHPGHCPWLCSAWGCWLHPCQACSSTDIVTRRRANTHAPCQQRQPRQERDHAAALHAGHTTGARTCSPRSACSCRSCTGWSDTWTCAAHQRGRQAPVRLRPDHVTRSAAAARSRCRGMATARQPACVAAVCVAAPRMPPVPCRRHRLPWAPSRRLLPGWRACMPCCRLAARAPWAWTLQ